MSRVPPGPGGHGLPPIYYAGGPPPGVAPPGTPQQMYGDPYAGYRGVPPPPFPPEAFNAAAGPSRDAYSTPTTARSMSGGPASAGRRVPVQPEPPSRHASWHKNDVFDQNGKEITSGHSTQQAGPSEFIKKLYKMLEDESAQYGRGKPAGAPRSKGERGSVGWGRGGTSFVVWDMNEFTTKILHSNFSSFVRQLNKYGFSKIKHVDEDTGQIKENVWEFQHPNFQAGGKADLDSIKRKAVVPKKAAASEEAEASPARALNSEDHSRMMDMMNRIAGLEDVLYKTQEQLNEARAREGHMINVLREVVGLIGDKERPSEETSARAGHIMHLLDQVAHAVHPSPPQGYVGGIPPTFPSLSNRGMPYSAVPGYPIPPIMSPLQPPPGGPQSAVPPPPQGSATHVSPRSDGARGSGVAERHSPRQPSSGAGPSTQRRDRPTKDDRIEIPQPQMGMAQDDAAGWIQEDANGAARASLRFMVGGQMPQNGSASVQVLDEQGGNATANAAAMAATGVSAAAASAAAASVAAEVDAAQGQPQTNGAPSTARQVQRRTIKPSWTHSPRILVVEDDVVYRQLSSKFLEKFGCVVETVENAQQGIEKMNTTKYDLVLMDIFFGPSMDGRKATSLIRQFDIMTPIISMTSNVQTKDVDSYLQSGMNDVLAKPFTKQHLFCILDKHLIHLKAIQLSAEVPRFLGVPPLSDQGVVDAITISAQQWETNGGDVDALGNPLAGSGWSDETYQFVLQNFVSTGTIPDQTALLNGDGTSGTATIAASILFPDMSTFNRKRSLEAMQLEEDREEQAKKHQALPVGTVTEMG